MECKECGFINLEGMKFCGSCGASLKEEKSGERKNATVFFTDISGFTRLSEEIDPEELKEILDTVFGVISESVEKYGGNVLKLIGDCAMCSFGAPRALENHTEKALLSLLLFYKTNKEIFKDFRYPILLHTGVSSGEVLVEEVGRGKVKDFTILGDAVNLASRLQNIAKPDEIIVSEEIWKRTKNIFDFEEIGSVDVKGKKEPVKIFRVIGEREKRGKVRGIEGFSAPMIGRKNELSFLRNSFEKAQKDKKDSIVLITGEPGIGKSRLLQEFKKTENNALFLECRSLPYETEPLYPLTLLLKNLILKKGKDIFQELFPDGNAGLVPVFPFIEFFLYSKPISEFKNLEPQEIKTLKFFVLESIFRKLGERENIVLCFEDVHWADEETIEFMKYIFSSGKGDSGILFILLSRPPLKEKRLIDFFEFIKTLENANFISLTPLTLGESMELIGQLLEIEELPDSLKRQILFGKSEGNPFFIEELIKILIEQGVIIRVGQNWKTNVVIDTLQDLPSTIEEVILSRVDYLDEEEKRFIKTASVIGRIFFKEGVEYLLKRETSKELEYLIKAGFVQPLSSRFLHYIEYQFKHILIQESIYNSLLKGHRKHLHLEFARWLEKMRKKYPNIPPGIIADHFELGGENEKAFLYNEEAAERAKENFANYEAIRRFKKALLLIDITQKFSEKKGTLLFSLGIIYSLLGENNYALETLNNALEFARDEEQKSRILEQIGNVYQKMSLYSKSMYYFNLAENFAKNSQERKSSIIKRKAWVYYLEGKMLECKNLLQSAEEIFEKLSFKDENKKLKEKANLENFWGNYYARCGNINSALSHYRNALEIYDRLNDIYGKGVIYNNMGENLLHVGKITSAINMLLKSLEIKKNIGNYLSYAISCNNLGEAFILLNKLDKAEEYFNEYLNVNKKIGNRLGDGYGTRGLAEIARRKKEFDKAEKLYRESIEIFEEVGSEIMKKNVEAELADFYMEKGDKKGAQILESIYPYALQNDINPLLFSINLTYAKYYLIQYSKSRKKGFLKEAEKYLEQAEKIFEKGGEDLHKKYTLYKLYFKLNQFWDKKEEMDKFQSYLENIRDNILEGIDSEEDKKNFLKYDEISALFD